MTRIFRSPALLALAAIVAGATALSPAPVAARVALALPLALLLPGAALAAVLFPASTRWLDRLPLMVGLSLAVCIAEGFALHWSPIGLRTDSWVPVLVDVTLAGAAVAWVRRFRRGETEEPLSRPPLNRRRPSAVAVRAGPLAERSDTDDPETDASPTRQGKAPHGLRQIKAGAAVGLALVLAVLAVGVARTPLPAKGVDGYTALSLLPAEPGSTTTVRVGVTSAELRETPFRLELRAGGEILASARLTLSPTDQWNGVVDIASVPTRRRSLEALLYRADRDQKPYRRATLVLPGSIMPPTTGMWLLWVDPRTVRVGATSAEPRTTGFRLELFARGRLERVARLTIAPGESWQAIIDLSSVPVERRSFLEARLYFQGEDDPGEVYRRVTLVPPGTELLEAS